MAFSQFIKKVKDDRKAAQNLDKDLSKIVQLTETAVKNRTPVQTGRLRNSFVGRKVGFLDYEVATAVKYAPFVEFGTVSQPPRAMMRKGARDISKQGTKLLNNVRRPI